LPLMAPLQLRCVDNAFKHGITEDEIDEVFSNRELPYLTLLFKKSGMEKIYNAFGVTEAGRYLVIGFVKETERTYRVIHAIDMKKSERKRFNQSRKKR